MTLAMVTDKEFLIAFSYADRDRAKLIRNYRWDPVEKVWRYPLTQRTYKELLREFDLDELEFAGNVSKLAEWGVMIKGSMRSLLRFLMKKMMIFPGLMSTGSYAVFMRWCAIKGLI